MTETNDRPAPRMVRLDWSGAHSLRTGPAGSRVSAMKALRSALPDRNIRTAYDVVQNGSTVAVSADFRATFEPWVAHGLRIIDAEPEKREKPKRVRPSKPCACGCGRKATSGHRLAYRCRVEKPLREQMANARGQLAYWKRRAELNAKDTRDMEALKDEVIGERDAAQRERDSLAVTVDRLTADLAAANMERDTFREAAAKARTAHRDADREAERLADSLAQMNAAVGRVEAERDAARDALADLTLRAGDLAAERDGARDALDSMAERADLNARWRNGFAVSSAVFLLALLGVVWGAL